MSADRSTIYDFGHKLTPREIVDLENELERHIESRKRGKDNGWRPQKAEWEHILLAVRSKSQ